MDLQPGPFLQGTLADVAIDAPNYDFTDDAILLAGELNAIAGGWDAFMVDLTDLAADPADPTFGIDGAGIIIALANEQSLATLPDLDTTIAAFDVADPLLSIAISFAPTAAWTDPTAPFVPPDPNATLLVPTVPLTDYTPPTTGVVGGGPGATLPTVTLQNLTRVGSQSPVVGDTVLVSVASTPGQQVSVDSSLNGVDLGTTVMGTTDAYGNWSTSAVEGPEDVGGWVENWYVGGQLVQSFSFVVSPGS